MDALVTLKLDGPEFDTLRLALLDAKQLHEVKSHDTSLDPKERQEHRTEAVKLSDLLSRVR